MLNRHSGATAPLVVNGKLSIERFAEARRHAHCFFEWVYFANVASTLDGRSVYLSRKALGEELARRMPAQLLDDAGKAVDVWLSTPEKPVFNRSVTLRDTWARIEKSQQEK